MNRAWLSVSLATALSLIVFIANVATWSPAQVSDAEMARRMAALNRRAASRPTTATSRATSQPAAMAPARASGQRLTEARFRASAAEEIMKAAQAEEDGAKAQIPDLEVQIAKLDEQVRAAWAELGQLVDKYNVSAAIAQKAGKSTVTAAYASGGYSEVTVDNPAKRLAAIQAVEDQFGPELKRAREKLSGVNAERQPVVDKRDHLIVAMKLARSKRDRAQNTYRAAMAILQDAPTTAPTTAPSAGDVATPSP